MYSIETCKENTIETTICAINKKKFKSFLLIVCLKIQMEKTRVKLFLVVLKEKTTRKIYQVYT